METTHIKIDLTNIISALIAFYGIYITLKYKRKDTYAKERYETVILPIFLLIEPYLFLEVNEKAIAISKKICTIVLTNRKYISGILLEQIDLCDRSLKDNSFNNENFQSLCYVINKEYNKSCRQLGIPRRTLAYRSNHGQYSLTAKAFEKSLISIIAQLIPLFLIPIIFILIYGLCTAFLEILLSLL